MNSDYDYEFPWRPIYEITAIAGWIGGAALAYLSRHWSDLPEQPFDWLISHKDGHCRKNGDHFCEYLVQCN